MTFFHNLSIYKNTETLYNKIYNDVTNLQNKKVPQMVGLMQQVKRFQQEMFCYTCE